MPCRSDGLKEKPFQCAPAIRQTPRKERRHVFLSPLHYRSVLSPNFRACDGLVEGGRISRVFLSGGADFRTPFHDFPLPFFVGQSVVRDSLLTLALLKLGWHC